MDRPMAAPDWLLRLAIPRVLGEENMKRLKAVYDWLNGRKRLIGAALAQSGIILAGVFKLIATLCAGQVLGGAVCAYHPEGLLHYIQLASDFMQQMPGDLTATGAVVWAIGWLHAASDHMASGKGLVSSAVQATVSAEHPKPGA